MSDELDKLLNATVDKMVAEEQFLPSVDRTLAVGGGGTPIAMHASLVDVPTVTGPLVPPGRYDVIIEGKVAASVTFRSGVSYDHAASKLADAALANRRAAVGAMASITTCPPAPPLGRFEIMDGHKVIASAVAGPNSSAESVTAALVADLGDLARNASTPEPPPKPNAEPAVWPEVIEDLLAAANDWRPESKGNLDKIVGDMRDRDAFGRAKYGTPLQPFNGRDALADAYQEQLDLCVYLRQSIMERPNEDVALYYSQSLHNLVWLAEIIRSRAAEAGR